MTGRRRTIRTAHLDRGDPAAEAELAGCALWGSRSMMTGLIVLAALLLVVGPLWYLGRHRTGPLARGIAAAGATYNEFNGQGRPPEMSTSATLDGRDHPAL